MEWDHYNFDALNIPGNTRGATIWRHSGWTRPKARYRLAHAAAYSHVSHAGTHHGTDQTTVRIIVPGRVYRYEATDATHLSMFTQIEGLAVDEAISMADLKGTLHEFARRFFGANRKVRFRCDFFPFVEPGAEMAVSCAVCSGAGCRLCGNSGWIEILGAGMVHPNVLEGVGIDPSRYSGFAFGMGIERIPMLRYGIEDIRHFYSGDLRFLRQF